MTAETDDRDDEFEELEGRDENENEDDDDEDDDNFDFETFISDRYGLDFPELSEERIRAVDRSLVRFGSGLCGMIVMQQFILTQGEAVRDLLRPGAGPNPLYVDFQLGRFFSIRSAVEWWCDCCDQVRLGPPLGAGEDQVRWYHLAMASAEPLSVRRLDPTETVAIRVRDPDGNWIRGVRIGGDCIHELLVESHLKPSDVGCPVVDEEGRIVRVVEPSDVCNWIPHR